MVVCKYRWWLRQTARFGLHWGTSNNTNCCVQTNSPPEPKSGSRIFHQLNAIVEETSISPPCSSILDVSRGQYSLIFTNNNWLNTSWTTLVLEERFNSWDRSWPNPTPRVACDYCFTHFKYHLQWDNIWLMVELCQCGAKTSTTGNSYDSWCGQTGQDAQHSCDTNTATHIEPCWTTMKFHDRNF